MVRNCKKKKKGGAGGVAVALLSGGQREGTSQSARKRATVSAAFTHALTHSLTRAQRQQAAATTAVDNRPVLPAQWSPPTVDCTCVAHYAVVSQVPTRAGEELGWFAPSSSPVRKCPPTTSNSASQGDAPSRHLQTD